jgi:hypothetical protein
MPRQRRLTREERLEQLEREMKAEFILDEAIASACWLNFQTHLVNHTFTSKIKCPLCRCCNNVDLNNTNLNVAECLICCESKPLLSLPCHLSHSFCKQCLEKLI